MNDLLSIPYVVYEQEKEYQRRLNFKFFVIIIVLIVALIGSNIGWIIYESQFETVTETTEEYQYDVEQDTGSNYFIGHDGDIINGAEN